MGEMESRKNVLVTGANGYIGSAVCRAFSRAGWHVFGLVRRPESAPGLASDEIVPVVGSLSDPSFLDKLSRHSQTFHVIVHSTEPPDYVPHFREAIGMICGVADRSNAHDVRPLVLWTSGCKDYGTTAVDGDPGLAPHTEESPLNPPEPLIPRATYSTKLFEYGDRFDAAVLRPTNVYGYSSSYYGTIFEHAERAAAGGDLALKAVNIDPKSIMHAMHVDDCGEAYVALATHPNRELVAGQCFNISAHAYETAEIVLAALAKQYGFPGGSEFIPAQSPEEAASPEVRAMAVLLGYSQWVGSEKIRKLTGWTDRKMLFSEGIGVYRRAYEIAVEKGHEDIARVKDRQTLWQRRWTEA